MFFNRILVLISILSSEWREFRDIGIVKREQRGVSHLISLFSSSSLIFQSHRENSKAIDTYFNKAG